MRLATAAPPDNPVLVYSGIMDKHQFAAMDAEFESRVRESFARQGLMKHFGAELAELGPGRAEIRVPFRMELTQQHGYFHAGVSGAIADSACGYAAYTRKTLKICAADVSIQKNGAEIHCATVLATIMCLPGKPDRAG